MTEFRGGDKIVNCRASRYANIIILYSFESWEPRLS